MKKSMLYISFVFLLSACSIEGNRNLENLENIQMGMSPDEVEKIMGKPISTYNVNHYHLIYKYESPFGYSDFIKIYFDSTYTVIEVHPDSLYRAHNRGD